MLINNHVPASVENLEPVWGRRITRPLYYCICSLIAEPGWGRAEVLGYEEGLGLWRLGSRVEGFAP